MSDFKANNSISARAPHRHRWRSFSAPQTPNWISGVLLLMGGKGKVSRVEERGREQKGGEWKGRREGKAHNNFSHTPVSVL